MRSNTSLGFTKNEFMEYSLSLIYYHQKVYKERSNTTKSKTLLLMSQMHTHHYVTYMEVMFRTRCFQQQWFYNIWTLVTCKWCDLFIWVKSMLAPATAIPVRNTRLLQSLNLRHLLEVISTKTHQPFLWRHPVYNQWDVRYWSIGRHIDD